MRGVWSGFFIFVLTIVSAHSRADIDLACLKSKLESTGIKLVIDKNTKTPSSIAARQKDLTLCASTDPKDFVVTYKSEAEMIDDLVEVFIEKPKLGSNGKPLRNNFLRCAFLAGAEKAAEKAADDMIKAAEIGNIFFSGKEHEDYAQTLNPVGRVEVCSAPAEYWKPSDKTNYVQEIAKTLPENMVDTINNFASLVIAAKNSSSESIQCLFDNVCVMGCAGAQQVMSWRTTWHLYDFDHNGVHDPVEKQIYDTEYPADSCVITPNIDIDPDPEKVKALAYYTKSPFHSALYEDGRATLPPAQMAKIGQKLLAGAPTFLAVSDEIYKPGVGYEKIPVDCRPPFKETHDINEFQNMIILSTTPEAMKQVMNVYDEIQDPKLKATALKNAGHDNAFKIRFERDYQESSQHLFSLSDDSWKKIMALGKAFKQSTPMSAYENFMHHSLDNPELLTTLPTEDQARLKAAQKILNSPFYRDTKVYLHPFGKRPLSFVMAEMVKKFAWITEDPKCEQFLILDKKMAMSMPVSMYFQENSMPFEQFDRFKSAIAKACTIAGTEQR